MFKTKNDLLDTVPGDGQPGGGAPAAPAPAPAPAAPAPAAAPATPAAPAASESTLLSQGVATPAAGHDWLPEKHRVVKEDGSLDIEASARKVAEAYSHAEKRIGSGDLPPKAAEEYKVEVPESLKGSWNAEDDEAMKQFKADALAHGLTQPQFDFMLERYFAMLPEVATAAQEFAVEQASAELQKAWTTPQDMQKNLGAAARAWNAFAPEGLDINDPKYGNDPVLLQILAKVGAEMREDSPAIQSQGVAPANFDEAVASLRAHPGYADKSHPEHAQVMQKITSLYERKFGTKPQMLGGGATFQI